MEYQSFRGNDVKQAIEAVRAALGPDALIQSTTRVRPRGASRQGYVEVKAGPATPSKVRWPFATGAFSETSREVRRRPPPQKALKKPAATGLGLLPDELEQEILSLRNMVEELTSSRPPRERAVSLLRQAGIEGLLARELSSGSGRKSRVGRESLKDWLTERIASRIQLTPNLIAEAGPQLIACVGPTGVGKTTTLAKLAARARLELERSVTVVSLDTFRVGAVEQWQRYSSLMNIKFHVAHDPETFAQIIEGCRSELVLVDSAGRSSEQAELVEPCLGRVEGRRTHVLLAVPAWLRAQDAERVSLLYSEPHPTSLVATKLDETYTIGGVLHAALPAQLPFSYMCAGPRVPEDIKVASKEAVLGAVFADN